MIILKGCKTCGGDVIIDTSAYADSRCLQCGRPLRQISNEAVLVESDTVAIVNLQHVS